MKNSTIVVVHDEVVAIQDEGETPGVYKMAWDDSPEFQSNKFVKDTNDFFSFRPHQSLPEDMSDIP